MSERLIRNGCEDYDEDYCRMARRNNTDYQASGGDLAVDYNFFDYVDNETIHIKNFVMATSLIRKSDTWASEDKIYQICGVVNECNEIFLMFDDLDRLIEASREIYARKSEVLCDNIFITVINVEMVANSVDEFLEKIKQAEEI